MNRKSILLLLVMAMLLIGVIGVQANAFSIKINVDTENEKQAQSVNIDGKSYFSVEDMKRLFGFEFRIILEDDGNKILVFENEAYDLQFTGEKGLSYRADAVIELGDKSNYVMHDTGYFIPVTAVAKAMSFGVTVDNVGKTVYLLPDNQLFDLEKLYPKNLEKTHPKTEETPKSRYAKYSFSTEDKLWLARIAYVEARDGSVMKKIAVANVVLNRVRSPHFPNTPYGVIFQRGQFPPAHKANFTTFIPPAEAFEAVERAIAGENNVDECLYFNMVKFKWKPAADFFGNIEGDYFYY